MKKQLLLSIAILLLPTIVSADDFDILRENLRNYVTLGPTDYDTNAPEITTYLTGLNDRAANYQKSMRKDTTILWNDLKYLHKNPSYTPPHINSSYNRLLEMSRAWAYPGGKLYHNEQLLADIRYGLDLLSRETYNKHTKRIGNWWEWRIGIPWSYGNIVSILYEQLTPKEIAQYQEGAAPFIRSFAKHGDLTYANKASICRNLLVMGILTKNKSDINSALQSCIPAFCDDATPAQRMSAIRRQNNYISHQKQSIRVSTLAKKEGLYKDGTFVQHNAIPYIGTYGLEIIQMAGYLAKILPNTSYTIPQEIADILPVWINNTYLPAMYRGEMLLMLMGRGNAADPYNKARQAAINIFIAANAIQNEEDRQKALKAAANAIAHDSHCTTPYSGLDPLPVYKPTIDKALAFADADQNQENVFSIVWAAGDKVIHQTDKWRACVSMSSNRIGKYECFIRASSGKQNSTGWYTGDGMTYLYLPNDTKQYYQYVTNVNPYRMPGTTVDLIEREEVESLQPLYGHRAEAAKIARAGGVSQNNNSSAMMQLLGGASDLKAKKSWFMFDKEVVCLGADIQLPEPREVITTVENRRFSQQLTVCSDNETMVTAAKDAKYDHCSWAYLQSVGGYFFPDKNDIFVNQTDKGNTEIWLSHGQMPQNAKYAYYLLPQLTKDEVKDYSSAPEVKIISNDEKIQAVYKPNINTVAANFWTEATLETDMDISISSDGMAAIIIKDYATCFLVSIADPTWERKKQVITISGNYVLDAEFPNDNVSLKSVNGNTVITVKQRHNLGMTQNFTLLKVNN